MNWAYDVDELDKAYKGKQETIICRNKTKIKLEKLKRINSENSNNQMLAELKKNEESETALAKEIERL